MMLGTPARPRTLAEKVWDDHVVASGGGTEPDLIYIDLHLVHEVTSPQAFDGLRLAGRPVRRPDLTHRHRRPQRADDRHRQADRRPDFAQPGRDAAAQLRRIRCPALPDGRYRAGHRARGRPAVGADPAGNDGRLRRQPHLDARRVRRIGDGHRDFRGRACAGHADTSAATVQDDGRQRRRAAAGRRDSQGHHPGGHRQDRHRRRPGLRHRIPRQRHRSAVDGGPDDDLQHEHRSRRAGGNGGPGRDHLRISARPPARADRRAVGCGAGVLGSAAHRRGRRIRHRGPCRRRRVDPVRDLGHQSRARACRWAPRCPTPS